MAGIPLWGKTLPVAILGLVAYALMQSAEFARQDYEMAVCAQNSTSASVTSKDICYFGSANNNCVPEGSVAVALMGVAAFYANGVAPPTFGPLREAFIARHFFMTIIWYFFAWALTLVPLIYSCYLLWAQGTHSGANLNFLNPSVTNPSALLSSMGPPAYNPCNAQSIYCLSITPGLLAGFGYLFAGATAFWVTWVTMHDTALKLVAGEWVADPGTEGAYFSAVAAPSMREPKGDAPHISQVR